MELAFKENGCHTTYGVDYARSTTVARVGSTDFPRADFNASMGGHCDGLIQRLVSAMD